MVNTWAIVTIVENFKIYITIYSCGKKYAYQNFEEHILLIQYKWVDTIKRLNSGSMIYRIQ